MGMADRPRIPALPAPSFSGGPWTPLCRRWCPHHVPGSRSHEHWRLWVCRCALATIRTAEKWACLDPAEGWDRPDGTSTGQTALDFT